jgi:D-alanine-D-alanine ligase
VGREAASVEEREIRAAVHPPEQGAGIMSRWNGKRIFVAYGGESSEREISLRTGQALAAALTEAGLAPQLIDVTRATIGALIEARPDVVLVAMHGHLGEDGALQGLLEWMGVPYTGSGVLASALAMDKLRTKQVLVAHNIPTPAWEVWTEAKGAALPALGLPCVVKPSLDGSSVGISLVKTADAWPAAIAACRAARGAVLVEEQPPPPRQAVGSGRPPPAAAAAAAAAYQVPAIAPLTSRTQLNPISQQVLPLRCAPPFRSA